MNAAFVFTFLSLAYCCQAYPSWPRPESLVGFWPFDAESQCSDIVTGKNLSYTNFAWLNSAKGPFGLGNTSYSVSKDESLFYIGFTGLPDMTSFTVSFYYYTQAKVQGGMIQFTLDTTLDVSYDYPNYLDVWASDQSIRYFRYPLLKRDNWNFIAISYDKPTKRLTLFHENVEIGSATVSLTHTRFMAVGQAYRGPKTVGMKKTDAMACLMLYNTSLGLDEINQLPYHCQTKGEGTTKIPVTQATTQPATKTTTKNTSPAIDSLVAFWPFDAESQLNDTVGGNNLAYTNFARLVTEKAGPFGLPNSSYSVTQYGTHFYLGFTSIPEVSSFTVSFFYYSQIRDRGGMVQLSFDNSLDISYQSPNYLEIWSEFPRVRVGRFAVLKQDAWNFVAVTYDKKEKLMTFFDRTGAIIGTGQAYLYSSKMIHVGVAARYNNSEVGMQPTDAMACLMVHNRTLTSAEIAELPNFCQGKGKMTTKAPPTTTSTTRRTTTVPANTPWPNPGSLLGYWPLSSQYKLQDVGPNKFNGQTSSSPTFTNGPFGDQGTATKGSSQVLEVSNAKLSSNGSFTITMFFAKGQSTSQGGIFEFLDKHGSPNAFQFRYENATTIEVSANGQSVGHYTAILQKGVWTFVAFVFDSSCTMFTVYGRHGVISPATYQPFVWSSNLFNNNGVRLGYASRWQQSLQSSDAVSCLMVYAAALTPSEIRQCYDACRVMHGSVPCGSPKLPISPIPSGGTMTKIPKAGQFPFIAALRFGNNTCSANILDAYWLLTSAQCFSAYNATLFTVYVGEHDLGVSEPHTQEHVISKVVASGNSPRDIALIQVAEPIDFTNEYMSDSCLFREEIVSEIHFDEPQFVFGWGKNGRQPVVSQTAPRYVSGTMLTDSQCIQAWGTGNYSSGSDFCFTSSTTDRNVPCSGDEGSPLLVQALGDPNKPGSSDRLVQVAMYYKRDADCSILKPALFVNLAKYTTWIAETIACAVPGFSYPQACPQ